MRPALSFPRTGAAALPAAAALLVASPTVLAHPGHGAPQAHGHATDAWGFVVVGALIAAALAFGRRK